jgi:hypothetical protein
MEWRGRDEQESLARLNADESNLLGMKIRAEVGSQKMAEDNSEVVDLDG